MSIQWGGETCHRYKDQASGAWVIQLTCGATNNCNIYGEQPYCSPDGRYIAVERFRDPSFEQEAMLLVADLQRFRIGLLARDVYSHNRPCNNAFTEFVYYWTVKNELKRISLATGESRVMFTDNTEGVIRGGGSVAPDHKHMVFGMYLPGPKPVVMRYELETGKKDILYEHPEIVNPHPVWEPVTGKYVMIMRNHGSKFTADGKLDKLVGDYGPTLFLVDVSTGKEVSIPAGQPHTARIGHQCFVPGTNRACFTAWWNMDTWECDPRHPDTNVLTAGPGDRKATPFRCPEHRGNHIAVSRCGTYFVIDSYEGCTWDKNGVIKPMALVVGNLKTGKYRILVSSTGATGGGNQVTHPHPYITTDNRYVIFNSDGFGAPHVFAAEMTPEFLASLG